MDKTAVMFVGLRPPATASLYHMISPNHPSSASYVRPLRYRKRGPHILLEGSSHLVARVKDS
jgi:hypothetical protein